MHRATILDSEPHRAPLIPWVPFPVGGMACIGPSIWALAGAGVEQGRGDRVILPHALDLGSISGNGIVGVSHPTPPCPVLRWLRQ